MLIKLTAEQVALIGATGPEDFQAKLEAYAANVKRIESAMEKTTSENTNLKGQLEAFEKRVAKLESVTPLTSADGAVLIKSYLEGTEGKGLIKGEASRVFLEAHASTGTTPLKPTPAAADAATETDNLIKAGNYEGAWARSKDLQAEFPDAKCYAAYARLESQGRVKISSKKSNN